MVLKCRRLFWLSIILKNYKAFTEHKVELDPIIPNVPVRNLSMRGRGGRAELESWWRWSKSQKYQQDFIYKIHGWYMHQKIRRHFKDYVKVHCIIMIYIWRNIERCYEMLSGLKDLPDIAGVWWRMDLRLISSLFICSPHRVWLILTVWRFSISSKKMWTKKKIKQGTNI